MQSQLNTRVRFYSSRSLKALPKQARKSSRFVLARAEQAKDAGEAHTTTGLPQPIEAKSEEDQVRLRAEAESPFRSVRMGIYGLGAVSSGLGFLVSIPQLIGALGHARSALPLDQVGQNLGINLVVGVISGVLLKKEFDAQGKQMARLTREEKLGALPLQLANGKTLAMARLRGSARVVIVAGTPEQVAAGLEAAKPFKEALVERGVLVVPLPIFGEREGSGASSLTVAEEDLRWCATPVRLDDWLGWFETQLKFSSKAKTDSGLFVGLRLDGRVRSSGMGLPPWQRYALELAPLKGEKGWTGFMDGFDGRV